MVFILANNILGIVVPSVVIAFLYVRIIQKIKNEQVNLSETNRSPGLSNLPEFNANRVRASDTSTLVSSILNLSAIWLGSSKKSRHAAMNSSNRSKHRSLAVSPD